MLLPVFDHLHTFRETIEASDTILFISDFDGTLVPIQNRPEDCFLSSKMLELLTLISSHPKIHFGVISGRLLADLQTRIPLANILLAGNHGLEIIGPDITFTHPKAVSNRPILEHIAAYLNAGAADIPGCWVENKGLTLSLHYRQVNTALHPDVFELANAVLADNNRNIHLRFGKAVIEFRPNIDWHKGSALDWIQSQEVFQNKRCTTIYLGDDDTDEDVFYLLRDGFSIVVGDRPASHAKYLLAEQSEVDRFIQWFHSILEY